MSITAYKLLAVDGFVNWFIDAVDFFIKSTECYNIKKLDHLMMPYQCFVRLSL